MPEGERKLSDMFIRPESPELDAAEKRSKDIMEKASVAGVVAVIDELIAEVEQMPIAKRFKRDGKIGEHFGAYDDALVRKANISNSLNPVLPESEFKRQQLLSDLKRKREEISRSISGLGEIVMDIEATKIDY